MLVLFKVRTQKSFLVQISWSKTLILEQFVDIKYIEILFGIICNILCIIYGYTNANVCEDVAGIIISWIKIVLNIRFVAVKCVGL